MIPPIEKWAGDRFGYYVDRHWTGGRWQRRKGPIRLAEHHARILAHAFAMDEDGRLPYDTVAICECAKSGKTALNALVHEWFALHVDPPGEQYVISGKQDQAASRAFRALCHSVEWNPHLGRKPQKYELTFKNGTKIAAIPSNFRTESGANFTLASFDEPWNVMYTDAVRLVSEFKPDPTRPASCRLFTGYAGFSGESEFWEELLTGTVQEGRPVPELTDVDDGRGRPACWADGRTFVFWSHVPRQPWQTKTWLASLERTLSPGEFRRLVHCDFSANESSYIEPAWWTACYDPSVPPADARTVLVAAVDASVSGDCTAIAAVSAHPSREGVLVVRHCSVWDPATQPGRVIDHNATIKPTLQALDRNHALAVVTYDPYQLAQTAIELKNEINKSWVLPFDQGNRRALADNSLRHRILNRTILHGGNPVLARHLENAGARVTSESKLRIVKKSRNLPVDAAVALSMACAEHDRLNL